MLLSLTKPELWLTRWRRLTFIAFLFSVALFIGCGLYYHINGHIVPPYADAAIYMQYAKAIGEGHPFRYQAWDAPTTGSTSHIYPFLLAIPYVLGMKGDALPTAGALLGIIAFGIFLLVFIRIGKRLCPKATPLALIMTVLSGHIIISFLGQNDMLLFSVLVALAIMAYLENKNYLLSLMLFLLPLGRPEGCILVFTHLIAEGAHLLLARQSKRAFAISSCFGVLGIVAMYGINFAVTGHLYFDSVLNKGYFAQYPLTSAIALSVTDFTSIGRQLFLGLTPNGTREYFTVPVLGGALFLFGLLLRNWKLNRRSTACLWLVLAATGQMILISTSGWIAIHYDRYFAWFMPFIYIFISMGVYKLARIIDKSLYYRIGNFIGITLIIFQLIALIGLWCSFAGQNRSMQQYVKFYKTLNQNLGDGKSIDSVCAYYLPNKLCKNFFGITSSQFVRIGATSERLEVLKHEPELRTDYLITSQQQDDKWSPIHGKTIIESGDMLGSSLYMSVKKAKWDLLDNAKHGIQNTNILHKIANMHSVAYLDVGYDVHEKEFAYSMTYRLPSVKISTVTKVAQVFNSSSTNQIFETGRAIIGYETMTLPTTPQKPLYIVLRTCSHVDTVIKTDGQGINQKLKMDPRSTLRVIIGENTIDTQIELAESEQIQEVLLEIPASAIVSDKSQLTIGGDHISYCYWFLQPGENDDAQSESTQQAL